MVKSTKPTTPEDYPSQAPPPSGDYSYTLEIVMGMQVTMGKLLEAVESLKFDSKEQRHDLKEMGKEIHAAKVVVRVLIGVLLGLAGLVGWGISTYITATHK